VAFSLALSFAIGSLAVAAATQLIVPLTLRILSLFVARRALGSAATGVRNAGQSMLEAMAQGQRLLLAGRAAHSPTSHARVDEGAAPETVPIDDDLERASSAVKR
jgi:hypothetical protein